MTNSLKTWWKKYEIYQKSIIINVVAIFIIFVYYETSEATFGAIVDVYFFLIVLYGITLIHSLYHKSFKSKLIIISLDTLPILMILTFNSIPYFGTDLSTVSVLLFLVSLFYITPLLVLNLISYTITYFDERSKKK